MPASKTGILSFGAYVPRLRLQRAAIARSVAWYNAGLAALGKGERTRCAWDEDTITMAVEAARDCLSDGGQSAGKLFLASTTLPFADRQNAGLVKEALNLPDRIGTMDMTGSQRAGTSALIAALESALQGPVLCIASEHPGARPASEEEMTNGDAAAAILVGPGEPVADYLGSYQTSQDFVHQFRAAHARHTFSWESRWVREEGYGGLMPQAVSDALTSLNLAPEDISHFILASPMRGVALQVAKSAGIPADAVSDTYSDTIGYAGCAQPLVGLAGVLEEAEPGAIILVAAFGQGCDILAFRVRKAARTEHRMGLRGWLARRMPDDNYIRHLFWGGELALDAGIRGEADIKTPLSMLYRRRRTILGLVGGKCRETGTVQFPKSDVSVAQNARKVGTQADHPLSDLPAKVVTFTSDRLGVSAAPPNCYGMVEFEGGGRFVTDFADIGDTPLEVGAPVRMMFRLKRTDSRGFRHYFWKAVPDYKRPEKNEEN